MSTHEPEDGLEPPRPGKCNAKKRQPNYEGERCKLNAGHGTDHVGVGHCRRHGGNTETQRRRAQVELAQRDVEAWGGRLDIHPLQALLDLVHWKAGEVQFWRNKVATLTVEELTWGTTRVKTGGDDYGTTEEAKPHIFHVNLRNAEADLEKFSSSAIARGCDVLQVRLAERTAEALMRVLQAAFEDPRVQVTGDRDAVIMDAMARLEAV